MTAPAAKGTFIKTAKSAGQKLSYGEPSLVVSLVSSGLPNQTWLKRNSGSRSRYPAAPPFSPFKK